VQPAASKHTTTAVAVPTVTKAQISDIGTTAGGALRKKYVKNAAQLAPRVYYSRQISVVAKSLKCGICNDHFAANFVLNLAVIEF